MSSLAIIDLIGLAATYFMKIYFSYSVLVTKGATTQLLYLKEGYTII